MSEQNNIYGYDERIDAFLKGEMTPEEKMQFKIDLKKDPELKTRAVVMASLAKSIRKQGREEEPIDEPVPIAMASCEPRRKGMNHIMHIVVSIAACLTIGVFLTDYGMTRSHTLELATEEMQANIVYHISSRGDDSVYDELQGILSDVLHKNDVKGKIALLEDMYVKSTSDVFNEFTNYQDRIGYYLALAYLQVNDRKSAKKTLNSLLQIYPDFKKAKDLLQQISDIKGLF